MDLPQIEAFLTLAEELHFGRAAQRLYVSQSMVSRHVTALEREVGGALFERTSRRVRLTPLGEQLRDRFQPAYHEIYAALTDASTSAKQIGGFLRVGVTATTAMPALTRVVEAFRDQNPDCQVSVDEIEILGPLRSPAQWRSRCNRQLACYRRARPDDWSANLLSPASTRRRPQSPPSQSRIRFDRGSRKREGPCRASILFPDVAARGFQSGTNAEWAPNTPP